MEGLRFEVRSIKSMSESLRVWARGPFVVINQDYSKSPSPVNSFAWATIHCLLRISAAFVSLRLG
jgi:hypothetical protein